MNNDTTPQPGRHIDFETAEDEFELIAATEPTNAYGPAWRERIATRHHLHNSIAS
jgi:hypothetical protein